MPDSPSRRLDVTGALCPLPVILARRALAELPAGATLEVVGDDPAMAADFRAFCASAGHRLLSLESREGLVRCRLAKASEA